MITGDIETTEKVEYEDLLKNYYEKMETIEEDKKIEKMSDFYEEKINENGSMSETFNKHELKIIDKINEIIDYINKEK